MSSLNAFILRPLQYEGTKMHPNVLLMCKLLIILLISHHLFFKIADPFIPFIPALDLFNSYPNVFNYTLKALFVTSAFGLLFNINVRTSSMVSGLVIILNILASKPSFFNHTIICGCALILAGLTNNKQPPYLLILQLSLVYFGASINKFMEPDWWSGAFMDTWLGSARENQVYFYVSTLLPDMILAKLLSYAGMFTEFIIAILLLFKRTRIKTLWFIIFFHTTLFTLTSFRFGHFLESLIIILLAFLSIPKEKLQVNYNPKTINLIKRFIKFIDFDKRQIWTPNQNDNSYWLRLKTENKTLYNHKALQKILLSTPNFFMLLFCADMAIYFILYNYRTILFIVNVILIWMIIFYFLPTNWRKKQGITYKSQ